MSNSTFPRDMPPMCMHVDVCTTTSTAVVPVLGDVVLPVFFPASTHPCTAALPCLSNGHTQPRLGVCCTRRYCPGGHSTGVAALVGLVVYLACFAPGMGPMPWWVRPPHISPPVLPRTDHPVCPDGEYCLLPKLPGVLAREALGVHSQSSTPPPSPFFRARGRPVQDNQL